MITLRSWRLPALGCLITLGIAQLAWSDTEITPAAGRRRAARETARNDAAPAPSPRRGPQLRKQQAPGADPIAEDDDRRTSREYSDPLLQLAERAIARTSLRYLDADQHTPWQIMHGIVALRRDFELTRGTGKINCIEFLSDAPKFRGEAWWQVTRHGGRAHPFSVPYAFEGHANQFLALLSMSNLPLTHEFRVDERHTVTMEDMVNNARMTVSERGEITWTLWFLTHYLDIDEEWTNAAGQPWSLERLVRIQTRSRVNGTPCGGCHGLFAIAYARNAYLQKHGRLHGIYYQAEQKLNKHIELARTMQNYDGSFSTEFFRGTGHSRDFNERLKASGHMLEWLMMALPEDRLNDAWVRKAVASISTDLIHNASQPAECGPLYHALNSLIMYRDRARGARTPEAEDSLELAETDPEPVEPDADNAVADAGDAEEDAAEDTADSPAPADLPVPEPPVLRSPRRLTVEAPAATPAPSSTSPSEMIDDVPPAPLTVPQEDPGEELARRAAERLARIVRDNQPGKATLADDPEPPGLLPAPGQDARRLTTQPEDRTIR